METLEALGIVESFSVASLIEGADAAVKTANVELIEIRLAMALGGKAFVTLTGDVAAVESAVDAGGAGGGAKRDAGEQSGDCASAPGTLERDDLGLRTPTPASPRGSNLQRLPRVFIRAICCTGPQISYKRAGR